MITHTFTRGWSNGAGSLSKSQAVSSGGEDNIDLVVPAGGADHLLTYTLNVQAVKGLYIVSTLATIIKTNSSSAPDNTITLAPNVPFMWVFGDAPLRDTAGAPITVDIASLHVSNPDATLDASLSLRTLYDPAAL